MTYDLRKYKFQKGQRVKVVDQRGDDRRAGLLQIAVFSLSGEKEIIATWDFAKGNTGTIFDVFEGYRKRNAPPYIDVIPDGGFGDGIHTFTPKEIRLIE